MCNCSPTTTPERHTQPMDLSNILRLIITLAMLGGVAYFGGMLYMRVAQKV